MGLWAVDGTSFYQDYTIGMASQILPSSWGGLLVNRSWARGDSGDSFFPGNNLKSVDFTLVSTP